MGNFWARLTQLRSRLGEIWIATKYSKNNCLNLSLNYPSWQHDRLIILTKHFIFRYSKTGHLSLLKKMVALLTPFPLLLVDFGPYHLYYQTGRFGSFTTKNEYLVGLAQTWQTYKKIWLGFGWDLVQGLLRYFQYPSPTIRPFGWISAQESKSVVLVDFLSHIFRMSWQR